MQRVAAEGIGQRESKEGSTSTSSDERLFNALTVPWPAIALDTRLCLFEFVGIGWINKQS